MVTVESRPVDVACVRRTVAWMDHHDDEITRELKARARRQKRQLDETLDEIEYRQSQRRVENISPEGRRRLIREWTRRIGRSAPIVAGLAILEGLRRRPALVGATAAVALTTVLIVTRLPEDDGAPPIGHPPAVVPAAPVQADPPAAVVVDVTEAPEPEPDPGPDSGQAVAALPVTGDAREPEPEQPDSPAPDQPEQPRPEPERPDPDQPEQPRPEPERPDPEQPEPDHELDEMRRCLEVHTPRVDLGECVRKLVGVLK